MMTNAPFVAHAGMMECRSAGSVQLVRPWTCSHILAALQRPRFAPVVITTKGGARRLAQVGGWIAMACDASRDAVTARPPAATFWRRDRSSGRGEHGDFSRLVPSRPATHRTAAHSSSGIAVCWRNDPSCTTTLSTARFADGTQANHFVSGIKSKKCCDRKKCRYDEFDEARS